MKGRDLAIDGSMIGTWPPRSFSIELHKSNRGGETKAFGPYQWVNRGRPALLPQSSKDLSLVREHSITVHASDLLNLHLLATKEGQTPLKLGIFLLVRQQAKSNSIFYSESAKRQIDRLFIKASTSIPIIAKGRAPRKEIDASFLANESTLGLSIIEFRFKKGMKLWLSTVAFYFGKENRQNRSLTLLWHARSISLWFSLIEQTFLPTLRLRLKTLLDPHPPSFIENLRQGTSAELVIRFFQVGSPIPYLYCVVIGVRIPNRVCKGQCLM